MDAVVEREVEREATQQARAGKAGWTEDRKRELAERMREYHESRRAAKAIAGDGSGGPGEASSGVSEAVPVDEDYADRGQLTDMRHVYERPPALDRTQGQRECRKWIKQDRRGFMQAKTRLEEAAAKAPRKGLNAEQDPGEDVGERVCLELLDRFLEGGDEDSPVGEGDVAGVLGQSVVGVVRDGEGGTVDGGGAAGLAG